MKKTISIAFAAFALLSFTSCQKENAASENQEPALRTITATFESNGTKTTHNDNVTPLWSVGDVILILNASGCEPPITLTTDNIKNDGRTITFTTNLSGTLYAVYPASATTMTRCDGDIEFTIPAIQDGTFGSANICVAKSMEDDDTNKDHLVFRNATAVLEIKTAADVVGVDVTAANNIAGAVTASFEGTALSLTTTSLDKSYVSAVGTSAPTDKVFYLAVAPGETGAATVNCYKTDKKGSTTKDSKILERNVIYSMDLFGITIADSDLTGQHGILNGHEYVIIKAKYDGSNDSYRKWATMNIGASSATDYGTYFAWGEVEGQTWSGSAWSGSGFSDAPDIGDPSVLPLIKDAANVNWGGSWRMPTKEEFDALCSSLREWKEDYKNTGVSGYLFKSGDKELIFLPAAGCGDGTDLDDAGGEGCYWSSSLDTSDPSLAYCLDFYAGGDDSYSFGHNYGLSVRALSE